MPGIRDSGWGKELTWLQRSTSGRSYGDRMILHIDWSGGYTHLPTCGKMTQNYAVYLCHQFSSFQSLSCVQIFMTPWNAACQASLSITNSWSLLKLMSTELLMPSSHLILLSLLLLPSVFPSIRVFSNESVLRIKVAKVLEFQLQHQSFQWIFRTGFL